MKKLEVLIEREYPPLICAPSYLWVASLACHSAAIMLSILLTNVTGPYILIMGYMTSLPHVSWLVHSELAAFWIQSSHGRCDIEGPFTSSDKRSDSELLHLTLPFQDSARFFIGMSWDPLRAMISSTQSYPHWDVLWIDNYRYNESYLDTITVTVNPI